MIKISFLISLLLLFACCDSKSKHKMNKSLKKKSIENKKEEESFTAWKGPTEEQKNTMRLEKIEDSLKMIQLLKIGKQIGRRHIHKNYFNYSSDSLKVQVGYLISDTIKHLWINRGVGGISLTDLYLYNDSLFIKICSKKSNSLCGGNSSFKDVNGDSITDFLYYWHPMSGCCTANVYEVHLQDTLGYLSNELEFINPAFYPKEKIIRGLCYGHLASFYKFKWNGTKVNTIEYIYRKLEDKNGNIIHIRKKTDSSNEKGIILKKCPKEYNNLWDDMEYNNK